MTDADCAIDAVGLLTEPVRRALYRFVAASPDAVGRDEAAGSAGVSRSLAAFHLDKLVEAGLLTTSYRRRSGRTGPGAGRPAKLYRRAQGERAVTVPPRAYASVAHLLAEVVDGAGLESPLEQVAWNAGVAAGRSHAADLPEVLAARGYQPYPDGAVLRLRNCPFGSLATDFPPLICGMNLALLEGLLAGVGDQVRVASLDPRPGECCVAFVSKTSTP